MTTKTYTAAQIDRMRATIATIDAKAATEADAKRLAYLTPVRAIIETDAFKEVQAALVALKDEYEADGRVSIHIDALVLVMNNLVNDIALASPVPIKA